MKNLKKLDIENYLSAEGFEVSLGNHSVRFDVKECEDFDLETGESCGTYWIYEVIVTDDKGQIAKETSVQRDENESAFYTFLSSYIGGCCKLGITPNI